jgi:hypothetical protein
VAPIEPMMASIEPAPQMASHPILPHPHRADDGYY